MANIVMCRVDERGIHGQVAASWTNTLNASRLMVVDDMAAKDDIQKMALKMASRTFVRDMIIKMIPSTNTANSATCQESP